MKKYLGSAAMKFLILVIVIAIFAAYYLPKYSGLFHETKAAVTSSVAALLSAANSTNYVTRNKIPGSGIAIANCTDVSKIMEGSMPAKYSITPAPVAAYENVTCTLNGADNTTAIFVATGIN